jgi:ribosome-associated protein
MSRFSRYTLAHTEAPEELAEGEEKPSKSARKRAAHAAQELGERLVSLRREDLHGLDLPERLREAIEAAQQIRSRGALARQRQFIGKLMREVDVVAIEEALSARERARQHRPRKASADGAKIDK